MALLQRNSCCSATTSLASPSLQPLRRSVLPLQKAQQWKLQRVSVCRASYGDGDGVALPLAETRKLFFKDESTGVVCYHDESGDVTCEGWDEGPHFQPDFQRSTLRRRRFTSRSPVQGRSDDEVVNFKNVKGRMGDSLIEVANESLECSEL